MFWNHRVVDISKDNDGEPLLSIQEVYYNDKGQPTGYCDPSFVGNDMAELRKLAERWAECLNLPVLNAETDFNNPWDAEVV